VAYLLRIYQTYISTLVVMEYYSPFVFERMSAFGSWVHFLAYVTRRFAQTTGDEVGSHRPRELLYHADIRGNT
jgi:hypothetical protein